MFKINASENVPKILAPALLLDCRNIQFPLSTIDSISLLHHHLSVFAHQEFFAPLSRSFFFNPPLQSYLTTLPLPLLCFSKKQRETKEKKFSYIFTSLIRTAKTILDRKKLCLSKYFLPPYTGRVYQPLKN